MPLTYTLCFLTRGHDVLMLYRNRPPNQFKWNGVGGKLMPGESPLAACLREVYEETGYRLATARFAGVLTWTGFEDFADGGLYLFTALAPAGHPIPSVEGDLCWHPRQWVYTSAEVVSNIPYFAPQILEGGPPCVYHFDYDAGQIANRIVRPLPANWVVE